MFNKVKKKKEYLNADTNLEDVWQLPEPGALGEQQWRRALTSDRVQVQFEPDGADFRNGWTNVLKETYHKTTSS